MVALMVALMRRIWVVTIILISVQICSHLRVAEKAVTEHYEVEV